MYAVRAGVAGAGLWFAVHAWLLAPRAPSPHQPGEWEVLLTARALASGDLLPAPLGTIHGFEFGSYLVAVVAALPIASGLDPVMTSKLVGAMTGATVVGLLTAWTYTAGGRRAAAVAAMLLACVLPSWHAATVGVVGSTPEGLVPQIVGLWIAAAGPATPRRAVLSGAALGLAWTFGPATLPAVGCAGLLGLVRGARARESAAFLVGLAVPWCAFAMVLPQGGVALQNMVDAHTSGWLSPVGSSESGWSWPLRLADAAGGGVVDGRAPLATAWSLIAPVAAAGAVVALRRSPHSCAAGLAFAALFWWLALPSIPASYRVYPSGYRYWLPALLLSAPALGLLTAKLGDRTGRGAVTVTVVLAAIAVFSGPLKVPPSDLGVSLFMTGGHRLPSTPGTDRDRAFRRLVPHVPEEVDELFAMGHGLQRGRVAAADEPPPLFEVRRDARNGLLFGYGCGRTMNGPPSSDFLAKASELPRPAEQALVRGVVRCLGAPSRNLDLPVGFYGDTPSEIALRAVGDAWNSAGRDWEELRDLAPHDHHEGLSRGFRIPRDLSVEHELVGELWLHLQPEGETPPPK